MGYKTKKSGKSSKRFGIYKCLDCNEIYERQLYEAKTKANYCAKCSAFHKQQRSDKGTGVSNTRLYQIHQKMKSRCNNKNNDAYEYYGCRGIRICEEWNDFNSFSKWSKDNGYTDVLTIDRIDVNGNYTPNNCRWVDRKIQQRNQRKLRVNNTSGYRGVAKHNKGYIVQITVDNKSIYLGKTKEKKDGAILYDAYVLSQNLEHTKNFDYPIGFIREVDGVNFQTAVGIVGSFVNVQVA